MTLKRSDLSFMKETRCSLMIGQVSKNCDAPRLQEGSLQLCECHSTGIVCCFHGSPSFSLFFSLSDSISMPHLPFSASPTSLSLSPASLSLSSPSLLFASLLCPCVYSVRPLAGEAARDRPVAQAQRHDPSCAMAIQLVMNPGEHATNFPPPPQLHCRILRDCDSSTCPSTRVASAILDMCLSAKPGSFHLALSLPCLGSRAEQVIPSQSQAKNHRQGGKGVESWASGGP